MRMRGVTTSLLLALAAWPATARDDFLRATTSDLSAKEKSALAERIDELGDGDPLVRQRAVRRIVAIGRPAQASLRDVLLRSSEQQQLRNACLAFGALGDALALGLLEHWFLKDTRSEEATRAALFALARGRGPLTPELSAKLRHLIVEAPLATVQESAVLCAGARRIAKLPALLKGPLQSERNARLRGCMVIALGESGDPAAAALVVRFLDPRQVRDEKLRRAALQATARLGDPLLLQPLLRFEPDRREVADYALALGAFSEPVVVERLGELLVHERDEALLAVPSLAQIATPEAKRWLERALKGDFTEKIQAAAALCVADLVDQQRFLPHLRALALGPTGRPGKAAALVSLARIGDRVSAEAVADALPLWREPELFERGLLYCAALVDRPLEEVVPEARRATVGALWREALEIERGERVADLLRERIATHLTVSRAHWLLARDDQRLAVLRELLELDKDFVPDRSQQDGDEGGGNPPPPGSGGGAPPGGDDGGQPPGGGGDDPVPPPSAGDDPPPGNLPGARRNRYDPTRIEHDLRAFLIDYSPFDLADPFAH